MYTRTTITLSRSAFNHNISQINALTGHDGLALVIKSNAYGHGLLQIAQLGQAHPGVSSFCTVGLEEALQVRRAGITKPIISLSFLDGDSAQAISQDIQIGVSSYEEAVAVSAAAKQVGRTAKIHVKIDSGMGRMGFLPHEFLKALNALKRLPNLELYGIRTHLSDTGHTDLSYSTQQLALFNNLLDEVEAMGTIFTAIHAQSSSSLNLIPERRYSCVRIGASAYGLWKSEMQRKLLTDQHPGFSLRPILEWRTPIIQLKDVPAGSYIGYKRTFKTVRSTRLAIVPVGYWDGYPYGLSNKGVAYLKGYLVPVTGIISMNMTAFDVTDVPDVLVGDELVLIGIIPQILAHQVASAAGLITNEVTTHIHSSINRTIVEAHTPLSLLSEQSSPAAIRAAQ